MDYKGNNDASSIKFLFQERIKWFNVFRDSANNYELKNGFLETNLFEYVFFHRVNKKYDTIIPNEDRIVETKLPGTSTIVRGNPIAINALNNLRTALINNYATSFNEPVDLFNIKVNRSYVSPNVFYNNYINSLMMEYHTFLQTNNYNNNITQFSDYVKYLIYFIQQNGGRIPLSLTAWQKSGRSNIFSSGLAFSISQFPCGDDRSKQTFIEQDGFDDYVAAAADNGFHVLASCPWILVYSIKSQDAVGYLQENVDGDNEEYNFTNESSVYNYFYNKTFLTDINNIKDILIINYNNYINIYPYYKKIYFNGKKTIQKVYQRETTTLTKVNNTLDDLYWLKFYNNLRNAEEDQLYNKADLARIEEKIIFFQNKFDISTTLGYINDQYRFFYLFNKYGINEYLRNLESEE